MLVAWLIVLVLGAVAAERGAVSGGAPRRAKRSKQSPFVTAVAVTEVGLSLGDYSYEDAEPLAADAVEVEMHACALTAGDVQQLRGAWGTCMLPLVPSREAVGVVVRAGKSVKAVAPGDRVGVLLGTGMDFEDVDNGADRNRLDFATTGAAAHRIRLPARWAVPLPPGVPTLHAAGGLATGGALWGQLKRARLGRGAKVGVVGGGTAGGLAKQLAAALGHEVHSVVAERSGGGGGGEGEGGGEGGGEAEEALCASDADDLRLHSGSFDALLCAAASGDLCLTPMLPLLKRGGSVLLAAATAPSLSVSPRLMAERQLTVVGGGMPSRADLVAFLAACEANRIKLSQTALEFSAESGSAALQALAQRPAEQVLLQRSALRSKWQRANRGRAAKSRSAVRAPDLGAASGLVAGGVSSMFGALSKAADEAKRSASAVREGISAGVAGLVEQVEREVEEEEEAKHGTLKLGYSGKQSAKAAGGEEDEEDEEDDESEEEEAPPPPSKKRQPVTPAASAKKQKTEAKPTPTPKQAAAAKAQPAGAGTPGAAGWTAAQEAALKKAAAATDASTPNRWAKVAEKVGGGKSKDACKKHFKELGAK